MKLTLTHHGNTYSVETPNEDVLIEEVVEHFRGLLVCSGYHPASVDQHFDTNYDWNLAQSDQTPPQYYSRAMETLDDEHA